jgi:hypothetical protein
MPNYSLVPVDYQPDFDGHSLVPVDYDPFAAKAWLNRCSFNSRRLNQRSHSRKPSRNSLRQEPVSPASTGRRLVTAPADRVAALASAMQELIQATRVGLKAGHPSLLPLAAAPIRRQWSLPSIRPKRMIRWSSYVRK